jgi:hypothetical protein
LRAPQLEDGYAAATACGLTIRVPAPFYAEPADPALERWSDRHCRKAETTEIADTQLRLGRIAAQFLPKILDETGRELAANWPILTLI